jgi:hypothetical protein
VPYSRVAPNAAARPHTKGLEIMLERKRTVIRNRELGSHTQLERITDKIAGFHNFKPVQGLPLPAAYCLIVDLEMNQFTALDEDGTETFTANIDPILAKAPQRELATT